MQIAVDLTYITLCLDSYCLQGRKVNKMYTMCKLDEQCHCTKNLH